MIHFTKSNFDALKVGTFSLTAPNYALLSEDISLGRGYYDHQGYIRTESTVD
jgi:hypothetical protein